MTSRTSKVDFTAVGWRSVEWTALCTLYLRACESRLPDGCGCFGDRVGQQRDRRLDCLGW